MNDGRRAFIKKRLVIGLGSVALIAAAIAAYFGFFRNHAPVITCQEPPSELYVGDAFTIGATVTDKEGVKEVLGIVKEPDGTETQIVLNKSNGSWENSYEVEKEGSHEVSIKAEDIKGKEATQYAGAFNGIPDTPPAIAYSGKLPESMYVGDEIRIPFSASDKEGSLEAAVITESQDKSVTIDANKISTDSYEAVFKPEEAGMYKLTGKATDLRGQEATELFGEIDVYMQEIEKYTPSVIQPGKGFIPKVITEGTGIESVVVNIEGFDNPFDLVYTGNDTWQWDGEEIVINRRGELEVEVIATNAAGDQILYKGVMELISFSSGGGGGGDGGGCFTADIKVLMSDGNFKPIIDIKENEEVQSFDFKTNKLANNKVTRLFRFDADSHLLINNNLKVTEKHPFAVGFDAWKEAGKLKAGDKVLGKSNVLIRTIKKVLKSVQVFNLTVDGTHNYFVSDGKEVFLVHNKGGGTCLLNDSLIFKEDNKTIKIQDLNVGDSIKSVDLENNSIVNTRITKIIKNHTRETYYSINNELFITNDHPVLALRNNALAWVRVENLKVGDKIKSLKDFIEIKNIEHLNKSALTVYLGTETGNFIVKAGNDYYVVKSNYLPVECQESIRQENRNKEEPGELEVGDKVLGMKDIKIESIEKVLEPVQVFNLTVDGTHNYFVSDGKEVFLVHNKSGGDV